MTTNKTSEQLISEVMDLVHEYAAMQFVEPYDEQVCASDAIESKLREILQGSDVKHYVPLTDEQIKRIDDQTHFHESFDWNIRFARAIERWHGIGVENNETD